MEPEHQKMGDRFGDLDQSAQGLITMEDLQSAYRNHIDEEVFTTLDQDGDRALDEEEWEQARVYLKEQNIYSHQTAGRGED